jgi:hypothetical protein
VIKIRFRARQVYEEFVPAERAALLLNIYKIGYNVKWRLTEETHGVLTEHFLGNYKRYIREKTVLFFMGFCDKIIVQLINFLRNKLIR